MAVSMRAANLKASRTTRVARAQPKVVCSAAGKAAAAAAAATALVAGSAMALTYDELQGLTYLQMKGSGMSNSCPVLAGGSTNIKDLKSGSYQLTNFCIEPTSFTVKEENLKGESEFVKTKLMTRLTYTLDAMNATLKTDGNGGAELKEEDGIDYAPVTVQLPGGERVPFLFTIKQFDGKGSVDAIKGDFNVPSYRGSSFLDPKGRGGSTGFDNAVALPARADDEELAKENNKNTTASKGSAVFSIAKVDTTTREVAGVFSSIQPSDTDLGAKTPKDVKVVGTWYARY